MILFMSSDNINYSEIFMSLQGEGAYTGRTTAWIRFFLCNLQCDGFLQKDPTDPSTYILPYKDIDLISVTQIEDLPVFQYGCDSSYTWSKRFKHLAKNESVQQICHNIRTSLQHQSNPNGDFLHPVSGQHAHMAFTGGEPMLNQPQMVRILQEFDLEHNIPHFVTVETNGTKPIKPDVATYITDQYNSVDGREWFWSCSPKLFATSGEKNSKAIKPEVVAQYASVSNHGQLKFVVNGTQRSWDEVDQHVESFKRVGIDWQVYIMPVGATEESQRESRIADIAVEAMKRGYHVSGRLHCYIFGNQIGT